MFRNELRHLKAPKSVNSVKLDGKQVDSSVPKNAGNYFGLYVFLLGAIFLLLSFEPFSMETNFTAAVACFNNIGPGFELVGATGNYSQYSYLSKVILSMDMLLGRLEIFPLLALASPGLWSRKR
jgi:trk system potassium uptake protein TrkH